MHSLYEAIDAAYARLKDPGLTLKEFDAVLERIKRLEAMV